MCGRFTLTTNDYQAVADALDADLLAEAVDCRARYNVAPNDAHPIVFDDHSGPGPRRLMRHAQWGMLGPDDARFHINARAETVHTKPAFRDALVSGRCLVAADGFFEWTGEAKQRMPLWFHRPDHTLMAFAAVYRDGLDRKTGEVTRRFAILTTKANARVAPVHDRMPVVMPRGAWSQWLSPPPRDIHTWPGQLEQLRPLLTPMAPDALEATEVSNRVNHVAHDDPTCIVPTRHVTQQSLF